MKNNGKTVMRKIAYLSATLVCVAVCLAAMWAILPHNVAHAYDSFYLVDGDRWDEDTFTELNYGIYWYDNDSEIPKKYTNPNANFDPSKPTLLFTHGMKQNEGYNRRDLLSLCGGTDPQFTGAGYKTYEEETGYNVQFYQELLALGFNVGQFYWSQLAEEDISGDVKIWCSQTDLGENYVVCNGNGERRPQKVGAPDTSVAVLYGESIIAALGADYNKPLRIVGHSMGGQLSLAVTQYLVHQYQDGKLTNAKLIPERVSLVDPYLSMTPFVDEGLIVDSTGYEIPVNSYTVDLVAQAMDDITAYGVAVDAYCGIEFIYRLYQMTAMGQGSTYADRVWSEQITRRLTQNAVWTYLSAMGSKYTVMSHTMIIDYYFTGMYEAPVQDNWGLTLPSVNSSTDEILSYRGMGFVQSVPDSTKNPFYQRYSTFERCDPYYNIISATLQGDLPVGTTSIALYPPQGDHKVALAENGKYNFAVQAKGIYTLGFTSQAGTTYAAFAVDGPDQIRALPTLDGPTQGAAKIVLVDDKGTVLQQVQPANDHYVVTPGKAGTFGVRLLDSEDKILQTNWFNIAEDNTVVRLAAIEGTCANSKVTKISLADASGKTVQNTTLAEDGTYRFFVEEVGNYVVQMADDADNNIESRQYTVNEDKTVSNASNGALKAGQIFLIVILSVVGAVLIALALVFTLKGRKKKKKKAAKPDYSR